MGAFVQVIHCFDLFNMPRLPNGKTSLLILYLEYNLKTVSLRMKLE